MFRTVGRHRKVTGARHRKQRHLIPQGALAYAVFAIAALPVLIGGYQR